MRRLTTASLIFSICALLEGRTFGATAEDNCKNFVIKQFVEAAQNSFRNYQTAGSDDRHNAINSVVENVFSAQNDRGCQALMLASIYPTETKRQEYAVAFNQLRNKTQNATQAGANNSSGGTTNLVSKNLTSLFLSVASEYGGMTQSTSGQTTTLSGTLSGVPLAVESRTGAPLFAECSASVRGHCINPNTLDTLSRFSYSLAISTTGTAAGTGAATGNAGAGTGTAQPVTLSSAGATSGYDLTGATAKVAILRQYPTKSALQTAAGKIDSTISKNINDEAQKLTNVLSPIDTSTTAAVRRELESAAANLLDGYPLDPTAAWNAASSHLVVAAKLVDPNFVDDIAAYLQAVSEYTSQEDLVTENAYKPTLSLEYDLNRPTNQPTNSNFKLIGSWTPGSWTLTLNAAASIYNSQPSASIPAASRLRDVQLATEADYKFSKSIWILGNPTLTTAFYYQDQTSPAILNVPISGLPISGLSPTTNQVFTQKGPIDIGQIKVSFGSSSSGFSVPLSVTFANRTELLTGMDVRGQIGISFNFDSLLPK
jgi:hypothetical protein